MKRRIFLALFVACLCSAAVAATFGISFASGAGRRADAAIFEHVGRRDASELRRFGHRIGGHALNVITGIGVIVGAAALALLSIIRETRLRWWLLPLIVGGPFATTELLKAPLGEWGRELAPLRVATDAFPSGHATLAMAIVLAAVMAAPGHTRWSSTVLGSAIAAILALLIVLGGLHPPSDVVGGYFVAGAWAALLTPFLRSDSPVSSAKAADHDALPRRFPRVLAIGAIVLAGAIFLLLVAEATVRAYGVLFALIVAFVFLSSSIIAAVGALVDLAGPKPSISRKSGVSRRCVDGE